MFERYTEKAWRVIFLARSEASQFGSSSIQTEHLLLGLLEEDKALAQRFLGSPSSESIRKHVEARVPPRGEVIPTSVDLKLSYECKRVLAYGAEEAARLKHKHIGTDHLLLGLLREENSLAAAILREQGLKLARVREKLATSRMDCDVRTRLEDDLGAAAIAFHIARRRLQQNMGVCSQAESLSMDRAVDEAFRKLQEARNELQDHNREHDCRQ